jgi:ABC-2 type transport system ATP-binding protein
MYSPPFGKSLSAADSDSLVKINQMPHPAIRTEDLRRTFKARREKKDVRGARSDFVALDGITLEIRQGELFGLLGSNGAGKTTLLRILTTLLAPSSGSAHVDGLDVTRDFQAIRERINMVSGGETSGYGILTVRENLWLFSQLYGVPSKEALRRIDKMLEVVGLTEKSNTRISHLSTGQRQKMNFCRGFITEPKILFLDEPTLGLDVNAARTIRQFLRSWMAEQPDRTLVLTTHYMMEADELCDRIAIVDRGHVLACDTPDALKRRVQEFPTYEMRVSSELNGWHDLEKLPGVQHCLCKTLPDAIALTVALHEERAIGAVVQQIVQGGSHILSLKKIEPTLEDAFIELVGHGLETVEVET